MQTTRRVENSSRERFDRRGVTINRNGPVYRTAVVVLVHVFGPVHTVTEVTTDITDTADQSGCHGAGPTWLSSVYAHAFSRLTATVGSHGSRRRIKSLNCIC